MQRMHTTAHQGYRGCVVFTQDPYSQIPPPLLNYSVRKQP